MQEWIARLRATRASVLGGAVLCVLWVITGCAGGTQTPVTTTPILFPPPPATAHVQYLGSVSSQADLPNTRGGFAEFILGPALPVYPLAKPISAVLHGSRLYICDTIFNSVLVYDLDSGQVHPLAGDRGMGKIKQPNNLAVDDAGRLYVADRERQAILVYNADESFDTALGHPGEAWPVAVAVDGDELFVCDRDEHEIEVWDRRSGTVLRRFGGLGNDPGKFMIPTALALDGAGHVYVTDTGNFRVQKLTVEGEPLDVIGGPGRTLGKFAWPKGLDVDGNGRLYVADSRFANVQIFNAEGRLLLFFGGPGPEAGNLDLPAGVTAHPWPAGVAWLNERLMPGFDPDTLVIVVSQQGQGLVNFFAVAREKGEAS